MMRPSLRLMCLLFSFCLACMAGCQDMNLFRSQSPDDEKEEDSLSKVLKEERAAGRRSLVRDYTTITGNKIVVIEGVGLVTQLDGTGGDSPATQDRKELLDEMRRMQIDNPNEILRSPYTALVIVRAYLPALVDKGEKLDVYSVRLPEGSEATSLSGGWLMKCDLWEKQVVPGRGVMSGKRMARAEGPILVASDVSDDDNHSSGLKRGSIPAGAVCLRDAQPLAIHLRSDYRSVRMANRMTQRIGERFHDYDEYGIRRPLARFRADSRIDLEVHPRYKNNDPRYLEVVRNIAFNEESVEKHLRMQRLHEDLIKGPTAEQAAVQLEAIGRDAIPILKDGLKAPSLESRFHSAIALAYLGVDDGVEVLAEAAGQERAFRVHAFAAMAALDGGEAYQPLIDLLEHPSTETRYGAFRTLTTLNANDPSVRGENMNDQFMMHVIPSHQEPLIHLTRRQKTELVLFGEGQSFSAPLAVNAGRHIWVTSRIGQNFVTVSRFEVGEDTRKLEVSNDIPEVIRAVVDLGASYPDVVQMLVQAERQHNLPGKIAIDALPQAGRTYFRPVSGQESGSRSTRVGHENMSPNLFPQTDGDDSEKPDDGLDSERESMAEETIAPIDATMKISESTSEDMSTKNESSKEKKKSKPKPSLPKPSMKSVISAISAYDESPTTE